MKYCYDYQDLIDILNLKGKNNSAPFFNGVNIIAICPFPHYKNGVLAKEKRPSFGINVETGAWNCFSCGRKGRTLNSLLKSLGVEDKYITKKVFTNVDVVKQNNITDLSYIEPALKNKLRAKEYLKYRNINDKLVDVYNIGFNEVNNSVIIPIQDFSGEIKAYLERFLTRNNPKILLQPKGVSKSGLIFGIYQNKNYDKIFITESVFDTLKINTFGYPSIATLGVNFNLVTADLISDCFNVFYLVPQNDNPSENWYNNLSEYLSLKGIVYRLRLPSIYKDIAEVKDREVFLDMLDRREYCAKKFIRKI